MEIGEIELKRQIGWYALTGIAATGVHFLVLNASVDTLGAVSANGIAFLVALLISYSSQTKLVFRKKISDLDQLKKFVVSAASGLAGHLALMYWLSEIVRWHYNLVFLIGLAVIPTAQFLVNRYWVFR